MIRLSLQPRKLFFIIQNVINRTKENFIARNKANETQITKLIDQFNDIFRVRNRSIPSGAGVKEYAEFSFNNCEIS